MVLAIRRHPDCAARCPMRIARGRQLMSRRRQTACADYSPAISLKYSVGVMPSARLNMALKALGLS